MNNTKALETLKNFVVSKNNFNIYLMALIEGSKRTGRRDLYVMLKEMLRISESEVLELYDLTKILE